MNINNFNYDLPKELIAQYPLRPRSSSRLMVLEEDQIYHRHFYEIVDYFKEGDVLVVNNSKVIKAKLKGNKETGGKVEVLIDNDGLCLIKGKIKLGSELFFDKNIKGKIIEKINDKYKIKFNMSEIAKGVHSSNLVQRKPAISEHAQKPSVFDKNINYIINEIGDIPLPPYIKNEKNKDKYQTVYAEKEGSVAAPTAGFHFDEELLNKIKKKKVKIANITLHISFSTFLPVKEEDYTTHKMYNEYYEIDEENAQLINNAKRLFIVGTTTIKALESAAENGKVIAKKDFSNLFIYPGYNFKLNYSGMLTNFHLPKSTLLLLVSAFYGRERILNAYKEAIKEKYRFYSFGDAMLLLK